MDRVTTVMTGAMITAVVMAFAPLDVHARIKCWTNNEGVRECGNTVPPEYAQKGHKEVSKQGITVETKGRAKNEEELAIEQRKKDEDKEKQRIALERARKDRVLLDTFTTEDDLLLTRDGKIRAIESRVQHTQSRVNGLSADLSTLQSKAAQQERGGRAVSDEMKAEISGLRGQIEQNKGFIEQRRTEQKELRAQFEDDLKRYRELKATGRR